MTDERLSEFIGTAKAKGMDDASLVALLRQSGWQDQRIYRALTTYYTQSLGVEVPSRGSRAEDARDAFLHLIAFITLAGWAVALIDLGQGLIDRALPSPGGYLQPASNLSWHIATIIIAFPIYLWVTMLIARESKARPESLQSGVRKWLTYVALVVASIVLIGDGVWLLAAFLTGDVTAAFAAKSVLVIAVTGGVFAYYLGSVRAIDLKTWRDRFFATAATIAVVTALVLGFAPIGSPFEAQAIARDTARTQALSLVATTANSDRTVTGSTSIPATIPGTTPAEYQRIDANDYRLCGTFERPSPATTTGMWKHPAGRYCFKIDSRRSPEYVPDSMRY